jgi:kinetochore protein Nuf2
LLTCYQQQPDSELALCVSEIGIPCTVEDLRKPKEQHVQKIFEYFAYILMNTTRDVVAPAMRAAAEELVGGEAERLYSADTRDLMGLFIMLRKLLVECSIDDFTFADLYRPTYQRVTKILSYIINFVRWRESQTSIIDKHFDEAERTKLRVQQLYSEKEQLEQRLLHLQRERIAVDKANAEKEKQFSELKPNLKNLIEKKDRLQDDWNRCQGDLEGLKKTYEDRATSLDMLREETQRLKPYTLQRPEQLETNLRELNATLAAERSQLDFLSARTRALATSADSFLSATGDIASLHRLLSDLSTDLQKEDEEASKAARHRDALSERVTSVEDVERQERMMQKQLEGIVGRTEKMRKNAEVRGEEAGRRMEELRGVMGGLVKTRGETTREVERRKVRIEQVEKKVCLL